LLVPLSLKRISRRRLLALTAVAPVLAACGETVAPRRLSQLWSEPSPDRAAALATAGWQGYWYARAVGGLIATQPGLGLPANTLKTEDHAALTATWPDAIPVALPFATATVDDPATPGGPPQVRQTDGVVRVRTAALYMRLLQALARAHQLRAPEAPATARTYELRLASAYSTLAVEASDRIQDDLFRPRLGVLFDSDDTYDPLGNIDLIWATADAARLALASGKTETATRLQSAADRLYAFFRKSLPTEIDEAHRMVRAQARLQPATGREDFRAFIPVQQRRLAYWLRDQQPAEILEVADALSALIRLTPLMPPESGVQERAGSLFLDLATSFDRENGWLDDRFTYTPVDVANLLRAVRLAAFHGQPPIERRYARDLLVTAWDSLVNRSGLMRSAPAGRADGVAQSWERHLDSSAYRHPAVPTNAAPRFARAVTRDASGWISVDPTLDTASALELALESLWLHPTFEALSAEFAA
jgi:type II secretory pathway pseudopilin PulG